MFLLDTNIVIYSLSENEKVLLTLVELEEPQFALSSISRMEVLIGAHKQGYSLHDVRTQLSDFYSVPVTDAIVDLASELQIKFSSSKTKFKDCIIAATALVENMTLITADKRFRSYPGLSLHIIDL